LILISILDVPGVLDNFALPSVKNGARMLFSDGKVRADYADFVDRQIAAVRRVHAGEEDLPLCTRTNSFACFVAAADSRQFGRPGGVPFRLE
jgi:hypothetical protein